MKKNNKFRNNGNGSSNAYSLNYRFDSISPAGKCSGTALDLIKRYNELAKEAHGSGDYIEMEVYRQYAEHYRKIVTEINERRAVRPESEGQTEPQAEAQAAENEAASETAGEDAPAQEQSAPIQVQKRAPVQRKFQVIEIRADQAQNVSDAEAPVKQKRVIRRRKPVADEVPAQAENV
jgi:hypothetical protein